LLPESVTFSVSAENTGQLYEFNRYGNTWDNFQRNLELLSNRKYRFCSVISNTTIHGYNEFFKEFGTMGDQINICNDPLYLAPNVIDAHSKSQLMFDNPEINLSIMAQCDMQQSLQAKQYIKEFARRRNLSLKIFPESFQEWLNEEVLSN
jgi:hypothetical protein